MGVTSQFWSYCGLGAGDTLARAWPPARFAASVPRENADFGVRASVGQTEGQVTSADEG